MSREDRKLAVNRRLGLAEELASVANHLDLLAITARQAGIVADYQPSGGRNAYTLESTADQLHLIRRAVLEGAAETTLEEQAQEDGIDLSLLPGPDKPA